MCEIRVYSTAGQAIDVSAVLRMRNACCITRLQTFRTSNTAFPKQQWLRERALTLYVRCMSFTTLSAAGNAGFSDVRWVNPLALELDI